MFFVVREENDCKLLFAQREKKWGQLSLNNALDSFRSQLEASDFSFPPPLRTALEKLRTTHTSLYADLLLYQMKEFVQTDPSKLTVASVLAWHQRALASVSQANDELVGIVNESVSTAAMKGIESAQARLEELKQLLSSLGLSAAEQVDLISNHGLQARCEEKTQWLRTLASSLNDALSLHHNYARRVLSFLADYALCPLSEWERHHRSVDRGRRECADRASTLEAQQAAQARTWEQALARALQALLDVADPAMVTTHASKALSILAEIDQGYRKFHNENTTQAQEPPRLLFDEIETFTNRILPLFGLSRAPPLPPASPVTPTLPVTLSMCATSGAITKSSRRRDVSASPLLSAASLLVDGGGGGSVVLASPSLGPRLVAGGRALLLSSPSLLPSPHPAAVGPTVSLSAVAPAPAQCASPMIKLEAVGGGPQSMLSPAMAPFSQPAPTPTDQGGRSPDADLILEEDKTITTKQGTLYYVVSPLRSFDLVNYERDWWHPENSADTAQLAGTDSSSSSTSNSPMLQPQASVQLQSQSQQSQQQPQQPKKKKKQASASPAPSPAPTATPTHLAAAATPGKKAAPAPAPAIKPSQLDLQKPPDLLQLRLPTSPDGSCCVTNTKVEAGVMLALLKRTFRAQFLDFIEVQATALLDMSRSEERARMEQLQARFDKAIATIKPRASDIEHELLEQRMKELRAHKARFDTHVQVVSESLAARLLVVTQFEEAVAPQFATHQSKVNSLQQTLALAANNVLKLNRLVREAKQEHQQYREQFQRQYTAVQEKIKEAEEATVKANLEFVKMLKLFGEGGTYNAEEVSLYQGLLAGFNASTARQYCAAATSRLESFVSLHGKQLAQLDTIIEQYHAMFLADGEFCEKIQALQSSITTLLQAEITKEKFRSATLTTLLSNLKALCVATKAAAAQPVSSAQQHQQAGPLWKQLLTQLEEARRVATLQAVFLDCLQSSGVSRPIPLQLPPFLLLPAPDVPSPALMAMQPPDLAPPLPGGGGGSGSSGGNLTAANVLALPSAQPRDEGPMTTRPGTRNTSRSRSSIASKRAAAARGRGAHAQPLPKQETKKKVDNAPQLDKFRKNMDVVIDNSLKEEIALSQAYYSAKSGEVPPMIEAAGLASLKKALPATHEEHVAQLEHTYAALHQQVKEQEEAARKRLYGQLSEYYAAMIAVPSAVVADIVGKNRSAVSDKESKFQKAYAALLASFTTDRDQLRGEVRPTHGHPKHAAFLEQVVCRDQALLSSFTTRLNDLFAEHMQELDRGARIFASNIVCAAAGIFAVIATSLSPSDLGCGAVVVPASGRQASPAITSSPSHPTTAKVEGGSLQQLLLDNMSELGFTVPPPAAAALTDASPPPGQEPQPTPSPLLQITEPLPPPTQQPPKKKGPPLLSLPTSGRRKVAAVSPSVVSSAKSSLSAALSSSSALQARRKQQQQHVLQFTWHEDVYGPKPAEFGVSEQTLVEAVIPLQLANSTETSTAVPAACAAAGAATASAPLPATPATPSASAEEERLDNERRVLAARNAALATHFDEHSSAVRTLQAQLRRTASAAAEDTAAWVMHLTVLRQHGAAATHTLQQQQPLPDLAAVAPAMPLPPPAHVQQAANIVAQQR
eukprot:TRINITY_DN2688_c0_g1_i2.p1 TRINITY_DN2688_c0_g1~~TRINITY_DN2688_c0_g1_i2.p1  ORF type:complete len:1615 (+),score=459.37 TRINITY_DN2688_c0_g1_i2:891-5735(+)